MLTSNEYAFQGFVFVSVCGTESVLIVETSEDGVTGVVIQDNSGTANVGCIELLFVSDSPETDVLFTARCHSHWIDWAELELDNVELRCLPGHYFWLLSSLNP